MAKFNEITSRIKDILSSELGDKKVFDKDIANALNINQITFATMKSRNKIPYQQVLDFCAKRKISINWLFYDQIVDSLQAQTEKFIRVRYFKDIYASAGGGAQNYEAIEEYLHIDQETLLRIGASKPQNIEAINVLGDSMEPTLNDGNIIFIDKSLKDIGRGGIFVVTTPGGLFIKRVQLKADGMVDLISDNDAYLAESLRAKDIQIVGRVIGAVGEIG